MKRLIIIFCFILFSLSLSAIAKMDIISPDGRIRIEFSPDSMRSPLNAPAYQVFYEGKVFLRPSLMGFELAGQPVFNTCFKITDTKTRENRNSWKPLYGERDIYPDNYNELEVTMQETLLPYRIIKVVFRAYNEGIAFRYEFPDQQLMKDFTIIKENTEFAFGENTYVWQEYGHEGLYTKVLSSDKTKLPFTRYTIGAADFTPGYCRSTLKNTWTHKLALPVIYYSPVQFLFWGEPLNEECHYRPELILWHDIPTIWNDTQVLQGDIGEYIIVVRKTGEKWFVGGITNTSERSINLKLDFLETGKKYNAKVFTDSPDAKQVVIEEKKVTSKSEFTFNLLPSGGFAIQIAAK